MLHWVLFIIRTLCVSACRSQSARDVRFGHLYDRIVKTMHAEIAVLPLRLCLWLEDMPSLLAS